MNTLNLSVCIFTLCHNLVLKQTVTHIRYISSITLAWSSLQDWAKPGPYDQPMVNTLRRKKDKESPALIDSNGNMNSDSSPSSGTASVLTSTPAPTAPQTPSSSASVEERNRTVTSPLKVSCSHDHIQGFVCHILEELEQLRLNESNMWGILLIASKLLGFFFSWFPLNVALCCWMQ